jgi:hypothetical protein
MTDSLNDGDLQALWQSQALDQNAISVEEIRGRAKRLERIVARRNLREYFAAVVVVPAFGWIVWVGPSGTIRAGAGMVILGTIFIVYYLRRRGSASSLPGDLGLKSALEFHCVELVRQRDLLRSVWLWALLPIVSGMLVLQIGQALAHPEWLWRIVLYCAVLVAGAAGLHALNHRAAARIQERIDRLKEKP